MKKVTLKLNGMHCTSCSVLIDTALEELPGVRSSKTSYADQKVDVEFDQNQVTISDIISNIKKEGYEAQQKE